MFCLSGFSPYLRKWGGVQEGKGPTGRGPGRAPKGPQKGGPPRARNFSSVARHRFTVCVSVGVFSWQFGGVLKRRCQEMCTSGVRAVVSTFLRLLATAHARSETPVLRKRAEQAWRFRWSTMFACIAMRAFAASLLEQRSNGGGDGQILLSTEFLSDHRHARLHV